MSGRSERIDTAQRDPGMSARLALAALIGAVTDLAGLGLLAAATWLIVTAAGHGACLALLAADDADMAMVAYEMNVLVQQVGTNLVAEPRPEIATMRLDPQR